MDLRAELLKSIWYAFTALDVEKSGKVSKSQLKVSPRSGRRTDGGWERAEERARGCSASPRGSTEKLLNIKINKIVLLLPGEVLRLCGISL